MAYFRGSVQDDLVTPVRVSSNFADVDEDGNPIRANGWVDPHGALPSDQEDTIVLKDGNDIAAAGGGNDAVYGDDLIGKQVAAPGNNLLRGGEGNDVMHGGDGEDIIYGGLDNDTIYDSSDDQLDSLYGMGGDDTYILKGDMGSEYKFPEAIEVPDEGVDTIVARRGGGWLPENVENLSLFPEEEPADRLFGFGNELNNIISGSEFSDELHGRGGEDLLAGSISISSVSLAPNFMYGGDETTR